MFRIFSTEKTKLAYDGTPEAPSADMIARNNGMVHKDMPAQGLPEGHPAGVRSVISHGINELTDNEWALLSRDRNFMAHVKAGYITFLDDDGNAIDPPEAPEYVPEPVANPAARQVVNAGAETLPEERTDAHAEQTGDRANPITGEGGSAEALSSATSKEVSDFFGLTVEERAAMYPALTPEGKAAVDADPRSQAV